jgi:hypothetical protein
MSGRHTSWCAGGHHCGHGEHRSAPITYTAPGAGTVTLTRIRTTTGQQYAEIRLSVVLAQHEPAARQQLTALLTHLQTLIGPPRHLRPAA